jgi:pimeloyl-ACP methyl ester carboxylesterase
MTSIYRSESAGRLVTERYRQFLERWPVPSEETSVATLHGETFVVACGPGSARPVFLLHGAGINSSVWMGDVAAWSEQRRVYAVDLIGEPGLSAHARPPLRSDAYARWLDDVLNGLGVERAAFVGTSLGAWVAVDYAIRRPDRVTRLALIVPGGIGRQRYGAVAMAMLLMPFGARGNRKALQFALGVSDEPATPAAQAFYDFARLIQQSYKPRRDRLPLFADEELRGIRVPLLAIVGARDRMLDAQATAARLRSLVQTASVSVRPDGGHLISDYSSAVGEFLAAESAMPGTPEPAERVCAALRGELASAMKRRDLDAVVALRTTIAEIENAQAIDVPDADLSGTSTHMSTAGHRAAPTELSRRELSAKQVDAILRAQIDEREREARRYHALGHTGAANHLRAQAAALSRAWTSIDWR